MNTKILTAVVGMYICFPVMGNTKTDIDDPLDRKIYSAFNSDHFELFANSVHLGGNPMRNFEKTRYGWVMCASTERGKERYLQYLLDKKFDTNFRQREIASRISTPLLCAINFGNIDAVKSLVANGADPAVRHCDPCTTNADTSAVWMAIISSKYEIAEWLYVNAKLSVSKTLEIIELIEKFPFPSSSPENHYRMRLIEKLQENGFEVQEIK